MHYIYTSFPWKESIDSAAEDVLKSEGEGEEKEEV